MNDYTEALNEALNEALAAIGIDPEDVRYLSVDRMAEVLEALNDDDTITTYIPAEAYAVYADNMLHDLSDFHDWREGAEEAYSGDFYSDEEFAQHMAEEVSAIHYGAPWPLYCIDWEHAARELMHDYFSDRGYYFRSM